MKFFYLIDSQEYKNIKNVCENNLNKEEIENKNILKDENLSNEIKLQLLSNKKDENKEPLPEIEDHETLNDRDIEMIVNTLPEKNREDGKMLLQYLLQHIKVSKYGFVKHKDFSHSLKIEDLIKSLLMKRMKIAKGVEEFLDTVPIDEVYIQNNKLKSEGKAGAHSKNTREKIQNKKLFISRKSKSKTKSKWEIY